MLYPDAPHLQCGFYFDKVDEADALREVAEYLLSKGCEPTGRIVAAFGDGIRKQIVPWEPTWLEHERSFVVEQRLVDPHRITEYLRADHIKVIQIQFNKIIGLSRKPELLSYAPLPKRLQVKHAIEIVAPGGIFTGPPGRRLGKAECVAGKRTCDFFLAVASDLDPSYGSIEVEWPLPTPRQLASNSGLAPFSDFYLSLSYISVQSIEKIERLYRSAYQERINGGIYISCYRAFNQAKTDVAWDKITDWSGTVARTIVDASKNRP